MRKNRLQGNAQHPVKNRRAEKQTPAVAQAQIPAAHPEAVVKPRAEGSQQEQRVRRAVSAAAQGPEEAVPQPQAQPQQTADSETLRRQGRLRHPCRRPHQPRRTLGSS
ncbi:MAG: hypothetical protein SPE19_11830 [Candidatus Faecousia sp.]|nr:hypothetical protein [Candidatus Faecousia sp.]